MPRQFEIAGTDMAGGVALSKGERNTKPNENIESRNMRYTPEGGVVTSLGCALPAGQDFAESGEGIDGIGFTPNYPDLMWAAVNGKIKYTIGDNTTAYEADPANVLTKDNPVMLKEYRGILYYCNGVENAGSYAVGQLAAQITVASTTVTLKDAEGYKFTNGVDKAYVEGDEFDYTAINNSGEGPNMTTVTNVGATHAAGTYVTQHRALSAPPSGTLKCSTMAFWRDTMWISGLLNEPNVLRYSKTVSSASTVTNVSDFSDGNNYIIGEGGKVTALLSTRDRLYVFLRDKIYYIGIEVNSSAGEVFSPDRLFSSNYGCPNAFCVAEMEDVVIVFTGTRVVRIGYNPDAQQILPDEEFDEDILPELATADEDQQHARVSYNPTEKILRVSFMKGGILRTAIYDHRAKKWSYYDDQDPSMWAVFKGKTYFGSREDSEIIRCNNDLNMNGIEIPHVYKTGRMDAKTRMPKRFIRGMIEGKIARGTTIAFSVYINGKIVGGIRSISETHASLGDSGTPVGESIIGSDSVGIGGGATLLYSFRYPFLISSIGEDIQLKFSSYADGSAWEIDKYLLQGVVYDDIPYKHF